MANKIKEIRILEPAIKEVKKEKTEPKEKSEEELEDEEGLESSVEISREEAKNDLKKLVLKTEQEIDKTLEQRVWDAPALNKSEENKKGLGEGYNNQSDLYGDSKNLYKGFGDQDNRSYENAGAIVRDREKEDNLIDKQKYLVEQRRDSNSLDESKSGTEKYPRGR